jgi:adenine-specific DNA-methyltransferase
MRYYGNKTKLLEFIYENVSSLNVSEEKTFFDLFSGTSSVSNYFKQKDYQVIANDWLYFCYVIAVSKVKINNEPNFFNLKNTLKINTLNELYDYLNNLPERSGFITKNYTPFGESRRQYFSESNGKKIDAIRTLIEEWAESKLINSEEECYLIASLLYAVNKVSNVTGTYGSYLKKWDNRALKELTVQPIKLIYSPREHIVLNEEALDVVGKYEVDILYLDPPYNSRQYVSNYFILELIGVGWFGEKLPEIYGHTGMCSFNNKKSSFSSKVKALDSFESLIEKAKSKYIVLSYNEEGIIDHDEIKRVLSSKGSLSIKQFKHKRYRSINQDGSFSKTTEFLFIVEVD